MLSVKVVDRLPEITPALFDVAGMQQDDYMRGDPDDLADDIAQLGFLRSVEHSLVGSAIPRTPHSSGIKPATELPSGMSIIAVHQALRGNAETGLRALGRITEYADDLSLLERQRAGRAIKGFAGFAAVRMTQFEGYWRRGREQQASHIKGHLDSYRTLKPFMPLGYRSLVNSIAHQNLSLVD